MATIFQQTIQPPVICIPAAAFATPDVSALNGKQYIVIACGVGKMKATSGESYIAFALPGK